MAPSIPQGYVRKQQSHRVLACGGAAAEGGGPLCAWATIGGDQHYLHAQSPALHEKSKADEFPQALATSILSIPYTVFGLP